MASIAEIGDEFPRDVEFCGNLDKAHANKAGPTAKLTLMVKCWCEKALNQPLILRTPFLSMFKLRILNWDLSWNCLISCSRFEIPKNIAVRTEMEMLRINIGHFLLSIQFFRFEIHENIPVVRHGMPQTQIIAQTPPLFQQKNFEFGSELDFV